MAKKPPSLDEVERRLQNYLSTHRRPKSGEEAYDFNIKIHERIEIPDIVKAAKGWSDAELNDAVETEMATRLEDFVQSVKEEFPWLSDWSQEGRTGGWLVLLTEMPALDDERIELPGGEFPGERALAVKRARQRLKDLDRIHALVEDGIDKLVKDLEDPRFWGIGVKDWMPGGKG